MNIDKYMESFKDKTFNNIKHSLFIGSGFGLALSLIINGNKIKKILKLLNEEKTNFEQILTSHSESMTGQELFDQYLHKHYVSLKNHKKSDIPYYLDLETKKQGIDYNGTGKITNIEYVNGCFVLTFDCNLNPSIIDDGISLYIFILGLQKGYTSIDCTNDEPFDLKYAYEAINQILYKRNSVIKTKSFLIKTSFVFGAKTETL